MLISLRPIVIPHRRHCLTLLLIKISFDCNRMFYTPTYLLLLPAFSVLQQAVRINDLMKDTQFTLRSPAKPKAFRHLWWRAVVLGRVTIKKRLTGLF